MTILVCAVFTAKLLNYHAGVQPGNWEILIHLTILLSFAVTFLFVCHTGYTRYRGTPRLEIIMAVDILVFFHTAFVLGFVLGFLELLYSPGIQFS